MKRLLVAAMASLAMLSFAKADEGVVEPEPSANVAKIGEVTYADLRTALTSATKGQTVELLQNVDLGGIPWEPVVDFPANFDGKGFEIQNLVITNGHAKTGLITMSTWGTTSGTIKNVTLRNVDVTGEDYVGTIIGNNTSGGVISNITVCGTIKVSGGWWVGGIAGHAEYGKIVDCHVNGDAGSFIGREGAGQVGGIYGIFSEGTGNVTFDCTVANVKLIGEDRVGGIGGRNLAGSRVCNCSVSNAILECPSLTNELNNVGGIVGEVYKTSDATMILNCTATDVVLKDTDGNVKDYRDYGSKADQDGYSLVFGTVKGESMAYNQTNFKLTNGLVKIQGGAGVVTKVADICAPGYGVVAGDVAGMWKIENVTPIVAELKGKNTASITLPNPMPTPGQTLKFSMKAKSGFAWVAYVNGKKATVSGNNITYVTDPTETTAEIYVAAVKSTAWYLDPFVKNTLKYGCSYNSLLCDAIMDENDEFLFLGENQHQMNNTNTGMYQYRVADIKNYIGAYYGAPVTAVTQPWHFSNDNFRRIMPSVGLGGVMVGCGWALNTEEIKKDGVVIGYGLNHNKRFDNCSFFPFSADWGDPKYGGTTEGKTCYYIEQSDIGNKVDQYQRVDPGCFSADGKYFYAGVYARRQISKVEIVKDENGKIVLLRPCGSSITEVPEPLTEVSAVDGIRWPLTDATKPQGMTMSVFGGEEVVYASLANGDLVILNGSGDTELGQGDNGERDYTVIGSFGADYFISMRVTGKKVGTPHLICQTKGGNTYVLELADDGMSLVSTLPIFKFNAQTDLANLYNPQTGFWHVTTVDDESLAFANYRGGSDKERSMVATLEKRPAKMTVRTTLGTYEEGTSVQVNYNAAKTTIVTAAPGRKLMSVKVNGVDLKPEEFGESAYTNTAAKLTQNLFIEAVEGFTIPEPIVAGDKGTVKVNNVGKDVVVGGTVSGRVTGITSGFTAIVTVGGVKVDLVNGNFSAPAVNGAQVMVAFVKSNAWYLDPFVKNDGIYGCGYNNEVGNCVIDANDDNVFVAYNRSQITNANTGMRQFGYDDLIAAFGGELPEALAYCKDNKSWTDQENNFRSVFVNTAKGLAFVGSGYGNASGKVPGVTRVDNCTVFPFGGWWMPSTEDKTDSRYYIAQSDIGNKVDQWQRVDPGVFSSDGKYMFAGCYARRQISKVEVIYDADGKVTLLRPAGSSITEVPTPLTAASTVDGIRWPLTDDTKPQGMAIKTIGGKEIVYASLANGDLVVLNGTDDTQLGDGDNGERTYTVLGNVGVLSSMTVVGTADGTPHLVGQVIKGDTKVFALTADGLALAGTTPIAQFNSKTLFGLDNGFCFLQSDDAETYAFGNYLSATKTFHAGDSDKPAAMLATIEKKPAQLIVCGRLGDAADDDTLVNFGAAVEKTWTAPAGYQITAVTVNGKAPDGFTAGSTFTFTSDALNEYVLVKMTLEKLPVAQIGSTKYTELDAAFVAAKAGDTVELLRDVEVGQTLRNESAITLDLGGFSLTRADGATGTMLVAGADLTVTNGTINGGAKAILNIDSGNVVLGDNLYVTDAGSYFLEVYNGVLTIGAGCVVEAKGCILDAESASVVNIYGTMRCSGESPLIWVGCTELNVYEGADLTSAGDIFRSNADATELNVYGGRMKSGGYPVFYCYSASRAVITIADGDISANANTGLFQMNCATASVKPLTDDCKAKFSSDIKHTFVGGVALADLCATGYAPVKGEDGYYTIQKLYDITIAAAENGMVETSVTNGIVAGTEVTITVTPAETYAVDKVYTNNVELAAVEEVYSFLMPAENVEVKATFKATAKPPYEPIPAVDPAAKAAEINEGGIAAKKAVIALPEGLESVPDSYYGLFSAVPGDGVVLMELNEAGTNAVETAEQAAGTAALDAVLGTDEASAALTVVEPLAGFFYSLKQSAAIESLDFKSGDKNKLGGRDTISFMLDKSETSGFYQMIVTPTPVK